MDHFVLGKSRVNCEIIEADEKGIPPDEDDFNESGQSLLDLVGAGNKVRSVLDVVLWDLVTSCYSLHRSLPNTLRLEVSWTTSGRSLGDGFLRQLYMCITQLMLVIVQSAMPIVVEL